MGSAQESLMGIIRNIFKSRFQPKVLVQRMEKNMESKNNIEMSIFCLVGVLVGAVGELPRSEVENFEGWSLGSSSCWLCHQLTRCSSSRQVTSFKVEQVCPSCTPVSPIHTSSRRSLVRGQTHLCTPSPLPPPSSCLHHQGPLLQQPPLGLSHPSPQTSLKGYF